MVKIVSAALAKVPSEAALRRAAPWVGLWFWGVFGLVWVLPLSEPVQTAAMLALAGPVVVAWFVALRVRQVQALCSACGRAMRRVWHCRHTAPQ